MKNILHLFSLPLILLFFHNNTFAQIKISKSFTQKLQHMEMDFYEPLENSYKKIRVQRNDIIDYDFAIKARKGDMEIRFALYPDNDATKYPHINVMSMASSVATNDEEAKLVLHQLPSSELKEYGADWGAMIFLQPKEMFTGKDHCKMLALYKEGQGLAYAFFLFDKATEEVDVQKYCLGFKNNEEQ